MGGSFKSFPECASFTATITPEEAQLIRTALVTARSAPAHERVIRTLRAWDIRLDESIFLGGLPKLSF